MDKKCQANAGSVWILHKRVNLKYIVMIKQKATIIVETHKIDNPSTRISLLISRIFLIHRYASGKLITGKQIGTSQLPKRKYVLPPIISLVFPFLSISQLLKLFYFSTISYLDCWEKINNSFTDGNREKIISGPLFVYQLSICKVQRSNIILDLVIR
jgi:hypothetical protein